MAGACLGGHPAASINIGRVISACAGLDRAGKVVENAAKPRPVACSPASVSRRCAVAAGGRGFRFFSGGARTSCRAPPAGCPWPPSACTARPPSPRRSAASWQVRPAAGGQGGDGEGRASREAGGEQGGGEVKGGGPARGCDGSGQPARLRRAGDQPLVPQPRQGAPQRALHARFQFTGSGAPSPRQFLSPG